MHPYLHVANLHIPAYPLLGLLGCCCAALYVWATNRAGRLGHIPGQDLLHIGALGAVGAMLGAKLLYLLTIVPLLLQNRVLLAQQPQLLSQLLLGGMVFYGGLFGGLFAAWLYCRKYGVDVGTLAAIATPAIPLFHAFGRVGCFLAGCCWGVAVPWGAVFTQSLGAPNGVPLFPVQLVEAGANLLLCAALALLSRRLREPWRVLPIYLIAYGCIRFVLEFFRGDIIRGVFLLSTSQWVALASVLCMGAYLLRRGRLGKA